MAKINLSPSDALLDAQKAYQTGDFHTALKVLEKLINDKVFPSESYRLEAACYMQLGAFENAKKSLQQIITLNEATIDDYQNLARCYSLLRQFPEAEKTYLECIKQLPASIELKIELIDVFLQQNKLNNAKAFLGVVLSDFPDSAEALYRQALITNDSALMDKAIRKLAVQKSFNPNLKVNLAKYFLEQADFKKSIYYLAQSVGTMQDAWFIQYVAGLRYYTLARYQMALTHFKSAINLAPSQPNVHLSLAFLYLTEGNLDLAWPEFEWRLKLPQSEYMNALLKKHTVWAGQDIKGKHLLIYAESNMGLTFLFLRYLLELQSSNKKNKITFLVPSPQADIIKKLEIFDNIITENNLLPTDIDYVASLQSLPALKKYDYGNSSLIPGSKNKQVSSNVINKIGLSWKASESTPYGQINPIDIETLTPMIHSMNASFFCLCTSQLTEEEKKWCQSNNIELFYGSNELLISYLDSLDLVITTDNDLAHISASINKPTWVMVPFSKSWYFGTEPTSTPWYSAMRLFHQTRIKDWSTVVAQVINALENKPADVTPESELISTLRSLVEKNQNQECFDLAKKAMIHYPNQLLMKFYFAIAAAQLGQDTLALSALLHLNQYDQVNIDVLSLLGAIYYRHDEIEKALHALKKVVEIAPENAEALKQLAISQCELHAPGEAVKLFSKAAKINPKDEYNFGLALALLTAEKFEEGWEKYEYRLKLPTHVYSVQKPNSLFWDGANLDGKSIFITQEQGLGDNIQFLRFLKLVKDRYKCKLILGCTTNLRRIAMQLKEIDQIISESEVIPDHDYHLPLLSLALRFNITSPTKFMSETPYIGAQIDLVNYWQNYLAFSKEFKIGFCWSGSTAHFNNTRRNCDLTYFINLLSNPHIKLFSLQKDLSPEDKELLTLSGIDDLGEMFDDLADTAAAISQMDLVISIDSAIAHLAGAMGKETWLALPYYVEWRHPRHYENSPWYKNTKYYRQTSPGDWDSSFKKIASDLADRAQKT